MHLKRGSNKKASVSAEITLARNTATCCIFISDGFRPLQKICQVKHWDFEEFTFNGMQKFKGRVQSASFEQFANPNTMSRIGNPNGHFTIKIEGETLTLNGIGNPGTRSGSDWTEESNR
jgi:hypothetical protein